jgi:hypothetical protein
VDDRDKLKIIVFLVGVPIIYYIRKKYFKSEDDDQSKRQENFFTGIAVQLVILLGILSILKYMELGQRSLLLVPVLLIGSGVVFFYYISRRS